MESKQPDHDSIFVLAKHGVASLNEFVIVFYRQVLHTASARLLTLQI